jgi:uncharacterized protein (TIGR02594 family)
MEKNLEQNKVAQQKGMPESSPENTMSPPQFKLAAGADGAGGGEAPAQMKGAGGMPADLASGFAASTGHDLSNVNVHYNSSAPAQVGALAYAQGNDIHLGAGQEQHLPHEAAHIVQQREGRVQANTNVNGMAVNDSKSLESEADSMGAAAAQMKTAASSGVQKGGAEGAAQMKVAQRKAVEEEDGASSAGAETVSQRKVAQLKEGDDPLKVTRGQVTFDAEGNDSEKSAYFSRHVHWPGGASGVTIGRGYDLGQRGKDACAVHLKAAGITGTQASTLLNSAGLTGKAAGDWVKANRDKVGDITHEQQKVLFNVVYDEHKDDVMRLSNKKDVKDKYGEVDFAKLHPAITDIMVDLRYRGDYHSRSRAWIQPLAVKNDLKGFAAAMADEKWKTDYGVPEDRFRRRKEFMAAAVKGGPKPALTEPDKATAPKVESAASETAAIDSGKVKASSLNVRSGAGPTFAKVGEPLSSGATVKVFEKANGWLRIGKGQWVSAEYVELTGNKDGGTTAPSTKPADNKPVANGTVTASQLNVRAGAGPDNEKVDTLKQGAQVQIFEEKDGWMRIGPARWVSANFVQKGTGTPTKPKEGAGGGGAQSKPAWISTAEGEIGQAELKAAGKHNPRIIEYHATTGKFKDDETPWCASFVNWVFQKSGSSGTNSASALSWKKFGKDLKKPAYGAVGVIDWGGGKGHVGFVVGMQGKNVLLLGGNQGDSVKISSFPVSKFVAFTVPADYEVPSSAYTMGQTQDKVESGGDVHATR